MGSEDEWENDPVQEITAKFKVQTYRLKSRPRLKSGDRRAEIRLCPEVTSAERSTFRVICRPLSVAKDPTCRLTVARDPHNGGYFTPYI